MRDHTRPGVRLLTLRSAVVVSVAFGMLAAAPVPAASQQPQKVFRVGHLAGGGRTPDGAPPGPLREGLRALGYVEGRNIAYEARFAEGRPERLPGLAAELLQLKVDLIVTQGGLVVAMVGSAKHAEGGSHVP
jgi:putative tryptophan/tyrosine transport system substrate-binding protein